MLLQTAAETHTSSEATGRDWLSEKYTKQLALLEKYLAKLASSTRHPSRIDITGQTVDIVRSFIGSNKWENVAELLNFLRGVGVELARSAKDPALPNVVRRIMASIREEASPTSAEVTSNGPSSHLWALPQHIKSSSRTISKSDHMSSSDLSLDNQSDYPSFFYSSKVDSDLKSSIMEAVDEIKGELEDLHKNIAEQASSHIHSGEIILTTGRSQTVEIFLMEAHSKSCNFQVLVAEGSPRNGGHDLASKLQKTGIETTLIPDASVFAVMSRVNKVVLPAEAVLANGGLVTSNGGNLVALGAQHHAVPVICTTGIFKLCPQFPHEGQDTMNELLNPVQLVDALPDSVRVINPLHDLINPNLVSLFVTNVGSFRPSFIYRLLAEYYHADDWSAF